MTKKTKEIADKIFNNPREEPDTIMCNEDVEVVKVLHSEYYTQSITLRGKRE